MSPHGRKAHALHDGQEEEHDEMSKAEMIYKEDKTAFHLRETDYDAKGNAQTKYQCLKQEMWDGKNDKTLK